MKGISSILGYCFAVAILIIAAIPTLGLSLVGLVILTICTFAGSQKRVSKAEAQLRTTLMATETPVVLGVQHRAFALLSRRALVAITDSRIITVQRGLFGGFKMTDVQWKDLKDVTIEQNILPNLCGSNLEFSHLNPGVPHLAVDGVPSETASRIYSRSQAEEQAWEEKRRVRAMEEVRAAAGGVVVHTAAPTAPTAAVPAGNRMFAEIQQAKQLLDAGTISDAEFQEMKSKILAQA